MHTLLLDLNGVIERSSGMNMKLLEFVDTLARERCAILTSMSGFTISMLESDERFSKRFGSIISAQTYGVTKGEASLYKRVLNDLRWTADSTVFVDDLERNVDAAHAAGLTSIRFDGDTDALIERLRTLLA